jgi:hypothetical protein
MHPSVQMGMFALSAHADMLRGIMQSSHEVIDKDIEQQRR